MSMKDALQLFGVNWTNPTWDMFIVIFFLMAAFFYGFSLGRDKIVVVLISLYMALAVVNYAPYIKNLSADINVSTSLFAFKISSFLAVFLLLFFFLSRSALLHSLASGNSAGQWWQALLFSILHTGLMVSVVLSFLPENTLTYLSIATREIFTSEMGRFIWIILPILALVGLESRASKS